MVLPALLGRSNRPGNHHRSLEGKGEEIRGRGRSARLSNTRVFALCLAIGTTGLAACGVISTPSPADTPALPPAPTLEIAPTVLEGQTQEVVGPPGEPPAPTLEVMNFWAFLPTPPPGFGEVGRHLMFFSNRTGRHELYQVDMDGSNLTRFSQNLPYDAYDLAPAWSKDGKLAFTSPHVSSWWDLFFVSQEVGFAQQLTNLETDTWSPTWSPDGGSLAFVTDATGDLEVFLTGLSGDEPTNLTLNPEADDLAPVWSPDGNLLAFLSERDEATDVFLIAPDGLGPRRLTVTGGVESSPAWSPDGRQIAFASLQEGDFEIFIINVDGSGLLQLTENSADDFWPAWSPDGRLIAFTSTRDHIETQEIYLMEADGSNQRRLTNEPANDIKPIWWP